MASFSKSPRDAIGWKHLRDQRSRIERHKEFIGKLEPTGGPTSLPRREMEETFATIQADVRRGRDRAK
jgi:hypothetical protein